MQISTENKQLVKLAGSLNLLFFLLCIVYSLYAGHTRGLDPELTEKVISFTLGSGLCWIINLSLFLFVYPKVPTWKGSRWVFLYLPSFLITIPLGILIANSHAYYSLSGDRINSPISGPVSAVISINSLSLLAIEVIRSYYSQMNTRMEHARMQLELSHLQVLSMEAQHEKLKNQLHPHFLFNSLTALKSLIRKDPPLAENYLIKLSYFLRFSISHNEQNIVPLQDELKFSLYYLEMQKIRFRDALSFTVEIPNDQLQDAKLPVFSLQLTLENAIKHNLLTQESPLHISLRWLDSDWVLIENNVQTKMQIDPSSGIGLKNLSDRYKLLTQEDIVIENDAAHFRVYLKVIRP